MPKNEVSELEMAIAGYDKMLHQRAEILKEMSDAKSRNEEISVHRSRESGSEEGSEEEEKEG